MAVQCVLVGKGKDDVFSAIYGETTFDKVLKAYNEKKVVQVIYQNRIYYLDNTTVVDSPEAFSFISTFSNQNDETGEIKHYAISLMTGNSWSGPFLQKSTPATHAKTHVKNGDDPLSPADIGAMELSENVLKQSNEDITSQVAQVLSGDLVPFSGGTMTGLLNVLTPVGDSNATTKKYVDDALSEKIGMDGIGDLHVWRKTVVTTDPVPEVPGSYTFGVSQQLIVATRNSSSTNRGSEIKGALASNDLLVDLAGNISLKNPKTIDILVSARGNPTETASYVLSGYAYFMIPDSATGSYCDITMPRNTVYFVPSYATYVPTSLAYGEQSNFNTAQLVIGVPGTPAIPAGTTTTYPVSINPKAYQEGNDAKPAGYTLGEVVTGSFRVSYASNSTGALYGYCDSVTVDDNGVIHGKDTSTTYVNASSSDSLTTANSFKGKFIYLINAYGITGIPFVQGTLYYIPTDAVFTRINGNEVLVDRYQPVTGYAAIPAGTTIEYLGKLGDKARVQVLSYVGTGTYGSDNPNSLTFDFVPKLVTVMTVNLGDTSNWGNSLYEYGFLWINGMTDVSTGYQSSSSSANARICQMILKGHTLSWYLKQTYSVDSAYQLNENGTKYVALGIG